MDHNFDAKFGPMPPVYGPPLPVHVVLLGQMVVCAVLLIAVQPPFVASPDGPVCMTRALSLSVAVATSTYLLHACGAHPGDTFRGACDIVCRAMR